MDQTYNDPFFDLYNKIYHLSDIAHILAMRYDSSCLSAENKKKMESAVEVMQHYLNTLIAYGDNAVNEFDIL